MPHQKENTMTTTFTQIGWIGLGQMGVPMVNRLLANNINVSVYNRNAAKSAEFAEKGAKVAGSVEQLVSENQAVMLMVSDYAAAVDILNPDVCAKLQGKVIVNMSTVSPTENLKLKVLVEEHGGLFAEAPVSGSVVPATNGTLLILFGGQEAVLKPLQPVFDVLGQRTFHFGDVGKGSGAKLVLNSLLGVFGEAYAEAMLMGEQFGINLNDLAEAIGGSAMNSPMFQTKKPLLLEKSFPAAFMLKHASKDLNLACGELEKAGLTLPAVETVAAQYRAAVKADLGSQDVSGIYLQLAKK
ncbi:NAD(P)-dependent oxidoreductase [Actinobacillus pleuropneumoniae]|uniref:NAD(P)-dependent oxidoreductase n=2 Tax=Actinobacillus pleuropneumoniae TaxID=715 RepID=UPI003082CF0E